MSLVPAVQLIEINVNRKFILILRRDEVVHLAGLARHLLVRLLVLKTAKGQKATVALFGCFEVHFDCLF